MDYQLTIAIFFTALFGLSVGSFLNSLVWRLHKGISIWGRSMCPKCGHILAWYDNIPLLSYILLHGRCRYCKRKISIQYPIVEFITSFLFVADFLYFIYKAPFYGWFFLLRDWIILTVLIFISIYDLKYQLVEDKIILWSSAIVFILNLTFHYVSLLEMFWSIVIAVGFFTLQYFLTKKKGIGFGDIYIGLFIAVSLGRISNVVLAIFLSYIVGGIFCLALLVFRQKKWADRIPLGQFLAIGTVISLFYGTTIINWYFNLLSLGH